MNNTIRVFIVDDHTLFREGLTRLLEREPRFKVVGSVGSNEEALEQLARLEVDVLIADYDLGTSTAVPLFTELAKRGKRLKSLLVTAGVADRDALELIRLGVAGIVHKQRAPEELQRSILDVAEGKVVLDQDYLKSLVEAASAAPEGLRLTDRERTILKLLLEGNSNKEISAKLTMSESAVKAALQQLFAKTGVRSRSQLVRIALEELRHEL
ncbi:MAG: response regulator transcription factor [Myxococcaceae bacterium]|nr:response regulator transcription factor [Myxococcaceae bacterium]